MSWQDDQDRLTAARAADGGRTPPPWNWEIHDASAATLCGGGLDAIIGSIMTVGPCKACYDGHDEWKWGRCQTPSEADARLIAAAPDMLAALCACADVIMAYDGGDPRHETGWKNDELRDAWMKARDAIMKAEGSTAVHMGRDAS